jgi:pyruvate/2-oxoglutarate dehydrogenase complex dihydrolipoamide dehydrogenase (E3) component
MKKYDAVIIGAGQAGTPLAKRLARSGLKTALIEKRLIGGTCINDGCTPTKTMIASARMAYLMNKSKEWGVHASDIQVDFAAVMARKDAVVNAFRDGAERGLKETDNLDILMGKATFKSKNELEVIMAEGTRLSISANKIFINTGASTAVPQIEGLEEAGYLTPATLLNLKSLPEHLLILGGSSIALEFGQMFSRFGSRVTIIESAPVFLKREDRDIAECMLKMLQDEGIDILIDTRITHVGKTDKQLHVQVPGRIIKCSHILLAAGRIPQTNDLGLQAAGIDVDEEGYIQVDQTLETNVKGIYALGDVKGGPAFTHIAYNDFLIVAGNILQHKKLTTHNRLVPYCTFTDPPLARVGLSEAQAHEAGLDFKVATLKMKHAGRAIENGETKGMMKAIVDAKTKKILGACIFGAEGGEVMSVLQMAMMGGITYDLIRNGIFAHPTYVESLNNLFMSLDE